MKYCKHPDASDGKILVWKMDDADKKWRNHNYYSPINQPGMFIQNSPDYNSKSHKI
jgi:hypothetical protein